MEKEFIPYEQALALKELGFDEPCFAFYSKIYGLMTTSPTNKVNEFAGEVILPLYQQAFRWFREKYNLHTWIYQVDNGKFFFSSLKNGRYIVCNSIEFTTYEEVELECLKKLIEIVKEK
jgi:hypothetical protein